MRFWTSVFSHQTNRHGTLIMGLKCFSVLIRFRRDIGEYVYLSVVNCNANSNCPFHKAAHIQSRRCELQRTITLAVVSYNADLGQ